MSVAIQPCLPLRDPACQRQQQVDDCFFRIAENAIRKDKRGDSSTKKRLKVQLDQHKKDQKAMRRAKASAAVYKINTKGELENAPPCLKLIDTHTEASLRKLESSLGVEENSLHPIDFSNEKSGYRAAVFYDQRDEKYVVTFRGTNKNNLIDWKNNINNQLPNATESDAPSYFAAKKLGKLLKGSQPSIEYTGHSKGGGEVYEALSNSPESEAIVFNATGPSPRIDDETKEEMANRVQNYQVGGEMLSLMQDETDPQKTIENMKWLRGQVRDGIFMGSDLAVKITERDNVTLLEKEAPSRIVWVIKHHAATP
jgi:hypothetical protein